LRYAFVDAGGFGWIGLLEECEAFAETCGVFVSYGEDADAALGTTRMTDEVIAASTVSIGYGGVDDLDEGLRHDDFAEGRALCKCPLMR